MTPRVDAAARALDTEQTPDIHTNPDGANVIRISEEEFAVGMFSRAKSKKSVEGLRHCTIQSDGLDTRLLGGHSSTRESDSAVSMSDMDVVRPLGAMAETDNESLSSIEKVSIEQLVGGEVIRNAGHVPKKPLLYRFVKRMFDIVFSVWVIILGFIPGLILCAFIAKDTGGSPLYSSVRVGRNGKLFRVYKFRSMVADSDNLEKYFTQDQLAQWHQEHKVDNDPRIASRIIDTTARRSSFGPAVASVFPPKMPEISAAFSQVKMSISNLQNLLKNSFQNLLSHTSEFTNFFAECKTFQFMGGPLPCHSLVAGAVN